MCIPLAFKQNQSESSGSWGSWPWVPRIISLSRSILFVALLWYLTLRCFFFPVVSISSHHVWLPSLLGHGGSLPHFKGNREVQRYWSFIYFFFPQLLQCPSGSSLKLPPPEEAKAACQWLSSCSSSSQCTYLPNRASACAWVFPWDSTGLLVLWGQFNIVHLAPSTPPPPWGFLTSLSLTYRLSWKCVLMFNS